MSVRRSRRREILNKPSTSTGHKRSYWLTCDKATIGRITVQCITIISTNEGKKTVFPVGSPAKYMMEHKEDSTDDLNKQRNPLIEFDLDQERPESADDLPSSNPLFGGGSAELAQLIKKALQTRLYLTEDQISCLAGE